MEAFVALSFKNEPMNTYCRTSRSNLSSAGVNILQLIRTSVWIEVDRLPRHVRRHGKPRFLSVPADAF